ncbi:MAG: FAD-dependent oxidoreductase, partial [Chloroflexota bacterium]
MSSSDRRASGAAVPLSRRTCRAAPAGVAAAAVVAGRAPLAAAADAAPEVRRLTPPRLEAANLGERILCHRPMRRGSPRLAVETIGEQVVAHDYGHGGSGWTLGPGSAAYVVDLVAADPAGSAIAQDAPVAVIGAGAIGLFTAYELVKRGYTDVTVIAEAFTGLTSHNAARLHAPDSMDNDPAFQPVIDRIGVEAYRFFAAIAYGTHPDFPAGAAIVPSYFQTREESGLEPYVGVVMAPAKDVVLDFGNGTTRSMVVYDDGIFIDTALMMEELTDFLTPHVTFEERRVTAFADVPAALVFDCTGLGAAELDADPEMVSVQGHLVMLRDQVVADVTPMIL